MSYADDAANYEKAMALRTRLQTRSQQVTPEVADLLGRAYATNRNLHPEVLTSLVLSGASEDVVWKANVAATRKMLRNNIDPFSTSNARPGPDGLSGPVGQPEEEDNNDGLLSSIFKSASRGIFTVLDSFPQAADNFASTFVPGSPNSIWTDLRDGSLLEKAAAINPYYQIARAFEPTTGGQVVEDLAKGQNVDLGSGFFPGGATVDRRMQAERDYRGTVKAPDGSVHTWTIGRGFATAPGVADAGQGLFSLVGRDQLWYNVSSGLIDAAVEIFADPTNYIPGAGWGDEVVKGTSRIRSARLSQVTNMLDIAKDAEAAGDIVAAERYVRKAGGMIGASGDARTLSPKLRQWRSVLAEDIGLTQVGDIKTTAIPEMLKWMTTGRGRRVIETISEMSDPARIMRLHGMKINSKLATALAKADNPMAVAEVYARAMDTMEYGQAALRAVPGFGRSIVPNLGLDIRQNINSFVRWGNYFPGSTVMSAEDDIKSIQNLDRMLSTLSSSRNSKGLIKRAGRRYDMAAREKLINKAIDAYASGNPGKLASFYDSLAGHFHDILVDSGWHPVDASVATGYSNQMGRMQRFTSYELMTGTDPLAMAYGDGNIPMDLSQLLRQDIHIVDEGAFAQAVREQGRIATVLRQRTGDVRLRTVMPEGASRGGSLAYNLERMPRVFLDSFFSTVWKPFQLLKFGYMAKVLPEETLRVAASGSFDGPLDILNAALTYRTSKQMRKFREFRAYGLDALENSWNSTIQYDALKNLRDDIMEQADEFLNAGDQQSYFDALTRAANLDPEIERLSEAVLSFEGNYVKALIGTTPDAAKEAITKDRTRYFSRGAWTLADRTLKPQEEEWVKGMYDALISKTRSPVDQRIANRGLFDNDVIILRRKKATWAEHVAAGRATNVTGQEAIALWLVNGEGRPWMDAYLAKTRGIDKNFKLNTVSIRPWLAKKTRDIAYLSGADEAAAAASRQLVGGDDEILNFISTGKFRGRSPYVPDPVNGQRITDPEMENYLRWFAGEDTAPKQVMYAAVGRARSSKSELSEIWQDGVSFFFRNLYGRASDKLSRSPTFRRIYWKNVSALLPSASADEAAKIIAAAEKAGLTPRLLDDIRTRARLANGVSTAADLDITAKGFALDKVQDLLFDATKKGAFMDQMRLILPFGDAYKEVFTAWTKIMLQRKGRPLKSLAKGLRAASQSNPFGPGDLNGDGNSEGVIYRDPTSGEWVFGVPASRQIMDVVAGTATNNYPGMDLTIKATSLNVLGNVMPSVGPFTDQLINGALPDRAEFDTIREWLFPYGQPADPEAPMSGNLVQRMFVPSWARKLAAADYESIPGIGGVVSYIANIISDRENDQSYLTLRNHVTKQLASQTNADGTAMYPKTQKGMDELKKDAETTARRLYATRGLIQSFTPAAPLSSYLAETKSGNVRAALVTEELRNLEQQYFQMGIPVGKAAVEIMDKYGPNVWLYAASNTRALLPGVESTKEWFNWWRNNKDVTDRYPAVGSYFGPTGGEFSQDVYGAQSAQGLRIPQTPDQMITDAKEDLFMTAYYRFRDNLESDKTLETEAGAQALRFYKAQLEAEYGMSFDGIIADRIKRSENQMVELQNMIAAYGDDPVATRMLDTEMGQRVIDYMTARQVVIEEAQKRGVSSGWVSADATLDLRIALRGIGEDLASTNKDFARLWSYLLENEMTNDDDKQVARSISKPKPRPTGALSSPIPTG